MLPLKNRIKLSALTLIVDSGFVYSLIFLKLDKYDKLFSVSVLSIHSLFQYYLYKNDQKKLDLLHYFLPILLIGASGLQHPFLIFISLMLLCAVKILWVFENRCILNNKKDTWGFTKASEVGVIILQVLLSVKLGYNIKKM